MNFNYLFSKSKRKERKKSEKFNHLCQLKAVHLCANYQNNILYSNTMGVGNSKDQEIIISLTSFNERLNTLAYTIESLMQQTLKADRIILWLAKEDVSKQKIPISLERLAKRGLEIKFCDENLGPYKKYFYALTENPNSLVLTVDDDTLYPFDMIENLYHAYLLDNQVIHCHRGHKMLIKKEKLMPYKQWEYSTKTTEASKLIFPTGVGGVLYFPGSLHEEALNKKLFMEICPNSDDIWLKAMSLKKNISCKTINRLQPFSYEFPTIPGSQEITLKRLNKKAGGNNEKIKAVFNFYNLWHKLLE